MRTEGSQNLCALYREGYRPPGNGKASAKKSQGNRKETAGKRRGKEGKETDEVMILDTGSEVLSEHAGRSARPDNFGVKQVAYETAGTCKKQSLFRRSEFLDERH